MNQQRERRPNSGEFADGGFASYFQAPFDSTVDFIFRGSIDWDAFVKAFARLRVQFGEVELRVQGIEDKGDGTFVVKVSVPVNAEKEPIHRSFTRFYVERVALNERGQQSELTSGNDLVQHWKPLRTILSTTRKAYPSWMFLFLMRVRTAALSSLW